MICKIVVFKIEEQRYGLNLSSVENVVRAVEVTKVPEAPDFISGIINVRGKIFPVINIRKRFHLPEKEIDINDCFILARTAKRNLALFVDEIDNLIEIPEEKIVFAEKIISGLEYIEGIVKMEDGMILIHNLNMALSIEEKNVLSKSLIDLE